MTRWLLHNWLFLALCGVVVGLLALWAFLYHICCPVTY
jgi:hypothetical protein